MHPALDGPRAVWRGALSTGLPRGRTLPDVNWQRRHAALLTLLAAHLVALPVFGLVEGWSLRASLLGVVPAATLGLLATTLPAGRSVRACLCALGLLSCSAALVVFWHGTIEAHFHYFVMTAALALYEEWLVYGLAVGYVVLQHGLMSQVGSRSVFQHGMGPGHHSMWFWALVHGGFVLALAVCNLVSWRANELAREQARRALAASRSSEERLRHSFDRAPIGMAILEADGTVVDVNRALARSTGRSAAELRSLRFWDLVAPSHRAQVLADWPPREGTERELGSLNADGTGWTLWTHSVLAADDRGPARLLAQGVDITRRKEAERELVHQAEHDPLTGLPNRTRLTAVLQSALDAIGPDEVVGVLFVDLDDFKVINDSLGHDAGDRLLVQVAGRLRSALRPTDVLARFGGDEFAVCMVGPGTVELERLADRLALALSAPFVLDGQRRHTSASIGLAVADGPDGRADALIRDADAAMYRAKARGKDRRETFDVSLREHALERLVLEEGLRTALDADELELHFQPLVRLPGGDLFGVEALLRWRHPTLGPVGPDRFIPIAESSGLIVPIGDWVLREACRRAAGWRAQGADVFVGVNLSARQLAEPTLAATVRAALQAADLEPGALVLEITETAVTVDPVGAHQVLQRLKALGVKVAIDDFGVGYSSLSHLRGLMPIDGLKIDKSFVDDIVDAEDSRAIVRAFVDLSAALGITAIAEGVETVAQAEVLCELGCGVAQGYHFGRPMPAAEVERLLLAGAAAPSA